MAPKVPRHIAMDLIKYTKKLEIFAYPFNQKHKSAVAFCEQMNSPRFLKLVPSYEIKFEWFDEPAPSLIRAEFTNGLKWEVCGDEKSLADLRYEFFEQAGIVDEEAEAAGEPEKEVKAAAGKKK